MNPTHPMMEQVIFGSLKKSLQAAALSLVWGGASALGAFAQTTVPEAPAEVTPAPQAKATATKSGATKSGATKSGATKSGATKSGATKIAPTKIAEAKKPASEKSAQSKSAQSKSAQSKSALAKSALAKSALAKSALAKPAETKTAAAKSSQTKKPAAPSAVQVVDELTASQPVSAAVADLADWVIASGDNRDLPFAVIDKAAAQILVFNADGKLDGLAPVLVGSAIGDISAPDVGERELNDIPLEDRTTPAGRYFAAFGPAIGNKSVLWVDYSTSISVHAIPDTKASVKETRRQRIASPTPNDNRITHGCINVSPTFYKRVIQPAFKKSGVFYILPETAALETAFPGFLQPTRIASSDDIAD